MMRRKKILRRKQHARAALFLTTGVVMLTASGSLLSTQASAVLSVREVSLPLVTQIPSLERRLSTLTDQVELSQLNAAMKTGSLEERVNVFVLPEDIDYDRLLLVFDILSQELSSQGIFTEISDVTVSDPIPSAESGLFQRSVSMKFAAHEQGVQQFLSLIRMAGILTIGDTLSTEERRLLLVKTEEENPAGIVAIEQFLSLDLLRYAREPKTHEAQLMRSFSSPSFIKTLEDMLQSPLIRDVRRILGGNIGESLERYSLWPLPFMTLQDVRIQSGKAPGWYALGVQLQVFSRSPEL
ncbi:hypothetical protein COU78_00050 [Candidatus Peregrinibacteria bacterium CG10_big_fil_rev_8_21_14_0_10_49_24]|nr:MAG: hypothetical protein COV83_06095 [Candidatus Peregrinibacteria bacterium CG11_big_fil_rev_8_21_14_0_20_49_14]PIR51580.1 MAG: hypothetical protein COU78_00050 [Candidatus Peregrinibacteria bacterium CG10_big_fil_rev_8_21_14_0_10_49_24]PJA68058.1 MAG: hypothetical protein CO157_01915 [Candidatus Peregrinibacteria bacterium CG_4_9_14_3_um_filter_49_12]